jgi:limonene 1,2-monooxygenase
MPLKFGTFMAPFHSPVGQDPTAALERDLEVIRRMDTLGFEEAWIGEHHSCGHELIPDPMIFIAHAANHTRHIKLGAGVVSLPYHNPLWVADRALFLDRLTRGRFMLGLGPGVGSNRRACWVGIALLARPKGASGEPWLSRCAQWTARSRDQGRLA